MHAAVERISVGAPKPFVARVDKAAPASAPPLILPGEHFAAALVFFVLGALALIELAPQLAYGVFFAPRVVAAVHLFTLGWIMVSIFGALCQFLPVAIGRPLRWQSLAHVTFGLLVVGAAGFISGLVTAHRGIVIAGASTLSTAFVLFAVHLAVTLAGVRERSVTWWALAGASVFLVVTPLYGVLLQLGLEQSLGVHRFHVVAVHAHVAIVGVVLMTIVGVAHRLIPMFLLSHGASEKPAKVALALLFVGASLFALPVGGMTLDAIGGVFAAGGVIAFVVQAVLFFRTRKRRALDAGMRLAAAGMLGLLAAILIAPFALSRGLTDLHLLVTYFWVLLGAISLFVAGHYYKIVPFLIWYHRFGPLVGTRKVPNVAELYSQRVANVDAVLLVVGYVGLAVSMFFGSVVAARLFAFVFAAGALVEMFSMIRISRRRAS